MADQQDEILGERMDQGESGPVAMVAAMDRRVADIAERVGHPAHGPPEAETRPARIARTRHARRKRSILRPPTDAGQFATGHAVDAAQEIDRFQLLAPALDIRHPSAIIAFRGHLMLAATSGQHGAGFHARRTVKGGFHDE
ncbi:hypothetical protein [Paracoccus sediminicola]|uniref:hypothetical protein n=1 Tax=Paracoccus sediminicola TaxID=3017783 RepID=UPI0022F029AB|nr:hypothetical protein [Paracoccus sediminicola]WBU57699.1 hypothetical protein PAF18_04485 [Paracoccus sediminicola]